MATQVLRYGVHTPETRRNLYNEVSYDCEEMIVQGLCHPQCCDHHLLVTIQSLIMLMPIGAFIQAQVTDSHCEFPGVSVGLLGLGLAFQVGMTAYVAAKVWNRRSEDFDPLLEKVESIKAHKFSQDLALGCGVFYSTVNIILMIVQGIICRS